MQIRIVQLSALFLTILLFGLIFTLLVQTALLLANFHGSHVGQSLLTA